MKYQEIEGDLIKLAKQREFDVIAHGCNCFCTMSAGIAPQMAKAFGADGYELEDEEYKGDINKLGQIDYLHVVMVDGVGYPSFYESTADFIVVNAYTQYHYGRNHRDGVDTPVDYEAIIMCMRKMNHVFKGKHIGLPKIGCGLAGGDWDTVKQIIQEELKDCKVTIVIYNPNK